MITWSLWVVLVTISGVIIVNMLIMSADIEKYNLEDQHQLISINYKMTILFSGMIILLDYLV